AIKPSATETCNSIDDNCNGQIDENLTQYPVYTDADGDGYGVATGATSCTPSTITPGDCDDNNSAINPSATEVCNDVDDNCDNIIDEGVKTMYYTDADGDGYGDINSVAVEACTAPAGTVDNNTDCDDSNALVNPAQTEVCNDVDDNCNGQADEGLIFVDYFTDSDLDGYGTTPVLNYCMNPGLGYTTTSGDCDDLNPAINPGEVETCNSIDDNCNGQIDENLTQYPVYTDADGDGYGVATGATSCSPSTILPGDCNDSNNAIKPSATETCNSIDDNCNGQIDENLTQYPVYTDADGDGYGVATGATSCTPSTITPGDCDDNDAAINPNATEVCGDDVDDNCDGQVNEGCLPGCTDATACNFDEAATYDDGSCTYATAEVCNNIDDDCDGVIDNGVLTTYYVDADGDGYGDINDGGIEACTAPQGTVDNNTDCNDSNNAIKPSATEACNSIDDNCNGQIDENLTQYPDYTDADGDGYGVATGATSCSPSTILPGDCNDSNNAIKPSATETCNSIDDNCNGQIDENLTQYPVYTDADGDGYGVATGATSCTPSTILPGDCNDSNSAIKPSATETCNNIDDNCNGQIDENLTQYPVYTDADGDGYGVATGATSCTPSTITPGDCNDSNNAISPAASEVCDNAIDENCDGIASVGCILGCTDAAACNFDPAATQNDGSCIYPQPEVCNAIDDDCDGQINEGFSIESLNATTVNTAYFPACIASNIFSANPFLGTNTATIDGDGKDRWYKWTAQYNSLRIGLSAAIGDYSIHLYREYPGCLALEMIEHEVTTGNQTLITDELSVGANYYFAVHEHAGPGNTSAKLCINHFLPSDCDHYYSNGTGEYTSVCGSFKTLYRGNANNYMINVLSASQGGQNMGIQPWVYQAGSSSVIARLGSILPSNLTSSPVVYTVNVPVMYSIPDAAENYTPVFAQATSTCTITLLPQTPIQVRASDRCPNIKAINSYIAPDQTICGSTAYQWELTDCSAGLQNATTQVLTGANGSSILMLNNIPGVAPGKFYQVRVRPVHGSGVVAAWGPVQCVMIQGSGMVAEGSNGETVKVSGEQVSAMVYPNPTTSGDLNVVFEKPMEGTLSIQMTNLLGQTVYSENVAFSGIAHKMDISKLSVGIFQMNIRINGTDQTVRLIRE
ncbi:MAG: hypothetical protein RLY35_772, partial [Bacteroidota bacterium]